MQTRPLFERLTEAPDKKRKRSRFEDAEQLKRSIFAEIDRILSTKSYFSTRETENLDLLSFGVAHISDFNEVNSRDLDRVRQNIEQAIRSFEPRLINPIVEISDDRLSMRVIGKIVFDQIEEPVVFPLPKE